MRPPTDVAQAASLTLNQVNLGNVFTSAQSVQISVSTTGATSVYWVVTDFFGQPSGQGSLAVDGQGNGTIVPNLGRLGYFDLQVTAMSSGSAVATAETTFAVVASTSLQTKTDSPFGICTHFAQGWSTGVLALVAKAGIANYRDEEFWQSVENTPSVYDFSAFNPYVAAASGFGLTPSIELDFSNSNYDSGYDQYGNFNVYTPYDSTGDTAYANYAKALVNNFSQIYGTPLSSVEVWNEYNGSYCYGQATTNRPSYYTMMLQAAYQAVKLVSPTTTVVGGACVPLPIPWFQSLFADGALDYMDVADIHPYVDPPEGLELNLASLQSLMAQYNHGNGPKPIWATECGYVDSVNPTGRQVMASYLVRIMTIMRATGVTRAFWYLLYDDQGHLSGLLHGPGDALGTYVPSSAFPAYANLIQQLYGTSYVRREATDGRTRFYLFNRATDSQQVRVLWSTTGTAQLVLSASAPLTIINLMGETTTVAPVNGLVPVSTDINPVYVVGPVTAVREVGRDQLVADSIQNFSGSQATGQGSWSYGCYDGDITMYGAQYNSNFQPMSYVSTSTEYAWQLMQYGYVKYYPSLIDQNGALPGNRPIPGDPNGAYTQVWSVRRWQSNVAGTAHITGKVNRASTMGDGTTARVFVDGVQIYSQLVTSNGSAQVDLMAPIQAGSNVDFTVDSGPNGSVDVNYDYVSFPVQIAVAAATPTTFSSWQGQHFTAAQIVSSAVSGDTANPAGDGLPNLVKYALGLDPSKPAVTTVQNSISNGYLCLTVPKNSAATDLTYTVEATSDLTNPASWTSNGLTVQTNTSSLLQVSDSVSMQGNTRRFMRLRVTRTH